MARTRWEYMTLARNDQGRVIVDGGEINGKEVLDSRDASGMAGTLNLAGAEGWECFSYSSETDREYSTWYLKRPVREGNTP